MFPPTNYHAIVRERLLGRRAIQPNGCWHYTRGVDRNGYGRCGWYGTNGSVHRVAYEIFTGPIPPGMTVNHACHDADPDCPGGFCLHRRCFNPDHLEVVTCKKNLDNGKSCAAVNAAKARCDNGHEFTPANTYIRADGCRTCRRCQAIAQDRYRKRQRVRTEAKAA
jgi:hypothetical protein